MMAQHREIHAAKLDKIRAITSAAASRSGVAARDGKELKLTFRVF
jgi:hypothetical protein